MCLICKERVCQPRMQVSFSLEAYWMLWLLGAELGEGERNKERGIKAWKMNGHKATRQDIPISGVSLRRKGRIGLKLYWCVSNGIILVSQALNSKLHTRFLHEPSCYRLKCLHLQIPHIETLSQGDSTGGRVWRRWLGPEGVALMNEISALSKETSESSLPSSTRWWPSKRMNLLSWQVTSTVVC